MRFGPCPTAQAVGLILAHSLRLGKSSFKKGRVLSAADVDMLLAAGIASVTGARLEPGDVGEDAAADAIAAQLAGANTQAAAAFTGRANLYASCDGLLVYDQAAVLALNSIDESLTLATLPPYSPVQRGQMLATVKIIPFALRAEVLAAGRAGAAPLRVAAFQPCRAGLIQTRIADSKPSVLRKSKDLVRERLQNLGGDLQAYAETAHEESALAEALAAMAKTEALSPLLIMGAAATVDRGDVVPAAIVRAGGRLTRFGMPVDPGNLLLMGELAGKPVIGLPGCARSPKLNGLDWVLARIVAGLTIADQDWAAMAVGGLLKEIPSRPQPREAAPRGTEGAFAPRVAAVVLAAGLSRRMAGANKLLTKLNGKPLILHSVEAALASRAEAVLVVLGHQGEAVRAALAPVADRLRFVDAADYAQGLSQSLRAGIKAAAAFDAAVICLGDMPFVDARVIDRLIAAFSPADGREICLPTHGGQRGNPVLWGQRFFAEIMTLEGDEGAKPLLARHRQQVCEVAADSDAVRRDIDRPEDLNTLN
ncbi:MAG: molybdopterin-binding/glycosyltransferase family 2 protein [Sphingomonadales bacterium]